MNDKVFIDTNIWVYAKIEGSNAEKHRKASEFLRNVENEIVVSTQVINEFYNTLSKNKFQNFEIVKAIEQFLPHVELQIILLETIKASWDIKERYGFSIYDSLIIAAAVEAGCKLLYTEDLQHNQIIYNRLQIINPLVL